MFKFHLLTSFPSAYNQFEMFAVYPFKSIILFFHFLKYNFKFIYCFHSLLNYVANHNVNGRKYSTLPPRLTVGYHKCERW